MKTLIVYRKRRFVCAALPFWLVTSITKEELCRRYQLAEDRIGEYNAIGPINAPVFRPEEVGVKLKNGQSLSLEIDESTTKAIFAVTKLGYFSNILYLPQDRQEYRVQVTARWSLNQPGYPELTLLL